jgi:uncharacterized protein
MTRDEGSADGDQDAAPRVRHDAAGSRYELLAADRVVCEAEYRDAGSVRSFTHTLTQPELRGRGYADALVRAALDDTRAAGCTVVPVCWFVRDFIDAHPDYRDLLAG